MLAALPYNANWFDVVWVIALLFGIWSGIRCGMLGEIIRLISWVLMVWLSVKFYEPVGDWFQEQTKIEEEPARLLAFLALVIGVYVVSLAIRKVVYRWTKKSPTTAFLETLGGALLGATRMALVMAVLTVALSLVRSPFLHRHVSQQSQFGSCVVKMIPSVEAVTTQTFPETFPLFRDLQRPFDLDADDLESNSTTKAH